MNDEKQLKLGWTVYETIGIAIVNPRSLNAAHEPACIRLYYKGSAVLIYDDSIVIEGNMEGAAMALAEEILKDKKRLPDSKYLTYRAIEAYLTSGQVTLNPKILNPMEPGQWDLFKREVEKICNSLTAFI